MKQPSYGLYYTLKGIKNIIPTIFGYSCVLVGYIVYYSYTKYSDMISIEAIPFLVSYFLQENMFLLGLLLVSIINGGKYEK